MKTAILVTLVLTLLCSLGADAQPTLVDAAPGIEKIQPELLEQMTTPPLVTRHQDTPHMHRILVNLHTPHRAAHPSRACVAGRSSGVCHEFGSGTTSQECERPCPAGQRGPDPRLPHRHVDDV